METKKPQCDYCKRLVPEINDHKLCMDCHLMLEEEAFREQLEQEEFNRRMNDYYNELYN